MNLIRIDQLFNFEKGSLQSSKCTSGKYPFITASTEWKTHTEYTHDTEALVFAAAASGSLGRTHYVKGKFIASDLCFILSPKDAINLPVDLQFYHIIFKELKEDIVKNTKSGTSKEAIGLSSFGRYEIPYFDIKRQIQTKNQFVAAHLNQDNLSSEYTHQFDLLKKLKQQILQDAIQGKLIPQDPKDEPANKLLESIKAEKEKLLTEKKIKKEKTLPEIKADEIPFEIPASWIWCRLGEIAYITSGSTPKQEAFVNGVIPYIKMYNLRNQKIDFNYKPQFIKEEIHNGQLKRSRTQVGDLLMNIVGPPLGKLAIIPETLPHANFNQAAVLIRPYYFKEINRWLYWYLNEMSEIKLIVTKGVAGQDNISVTQSNYMKIPLPPLSEQNHIIAKIEQLMKLCNELEQSIQKNEKYTQELLQVALKEALEPK